MFLIIRKSLITFLLVLQFFAPLVHAHVSEQNHAYSNKSLTVVHLPGFEIYEADQRQLELQAIATPLNLQDIVVGVDTGIKNVNSNINTDNSYFLLQQALSFNATYSPFDSNFSPHDGQFVSCLFITAHSPRAPPAL